MRGTRFCVDLNIEMLIVHPREHARLCREKVGAGGLMCGTSGPIVACACASVCCLPAILPYGHALR